MCKNSSRHCNLRWHRFSRRCDCDVHVVVPERHKCLLQRRLVHRGQWTSPMHDDNILRTRMYNGIDHYSYL